MPKSPTQPKTTRFRQIPSMESILSSTSVEPLIRSFGREQVKGKVRTFLDELRQRKGDFDLRELSERVGAQLEVEQRSDLRPVINGTGVLIHTNLGRSPLSRAHQHAAEEVLSGYSTLEFDLSDGSRGSRHHHIETVATELFGCEGALLVNNNAAGVLLALSAIASGREVIVSRGELVEIGGSFRVPDIIQQGGAILREVGTTNRTRATDYESAITPETAAILVVHQSNFKIVGFTEEPALRDLIGVAHANGVPLIIDEGSGRVVDLHRYGLPRHPTVAEMIEMGADLVTCSTDKLIGSSQGGLLLGRQDLVRACRQHPLMRAVRPGKESFAWTVAALSSFAREQYEQEIPIYRMLATSIDSLRERAGTIAGDLECVIVETDAVVGGGTTPTETLPSIALAFRSDPTTLAATLRRNDPPVIGRVQDDQFLVDLRTVLPEYDLVLAEALAKAVTR